MSSTLNAFIYAIRYEAPHIISLELRPAEGAQLPGFEAGAHIDLHLPNGLLRSYSLLNDQSETHRYQIGVLHDAKSRGGSRCVHEQLRVGMAIAITPPRNNFGLHEQANHSVLVAGGIGVTPILGMARRLYALGRSFDVIYLARSRPNAAFRSELEPLCPAIDWHFDDEKGAPDLNLLLSRHPQNPNTHYYACGPAPMLDAFERSCAHLGHANAHIERFAAVAPPVSPHAQTSYTVELRKSGKNITVMPDKSLLHTLLDAGIAVPYSCGEGICGSCETRVLEGQPEHRDSVLSSAERARNQSMMVCVSGAQCGHLVLDI